MIESLNKLENDIGRRTDQSPLARFGKAHERLDIPRRNPKKLALRQFKAIFHIPLVAQYGAFPL